MTKKFYDKDDYIILQQIDSHGINFEFNVQKTIWGVRNVPIRLNMDIEVEGDEPNILIRNTLKFSECFRCGLLEETNYRPHNCGDKPKVAILV
jgi:hypothetical protein